VQISLTGKNNVEKKNLLWFYFLSLAFVIINSIAIYKDFYFLSALPLVILILALGIIALDKLLLFIVFATPLSISLRELGLNLGVDIYLPTEPLLVFVLAIFFLKLLYEKKFNKETLRHPVTIAIFIYLGWLLITSFTSSFPVISLKFFLAKLWFIIPFYIIGIQFFRNSKNIYRFITAYSLALSIVVIYSLLRLKTYGMVNENAAHWVMSPFYHDHTSYGAILAMFLPVVLSLTFNSKKTFYKLLFGGLTILFFIGLIFSYTRAAWISVIVIFFIYFAVILKIKFRTILITSGIIIGLFFGFKTQLLLKMEQNNATSNKSFSTHIMSITNISNDDSNLERINRWKSAIRMFKEKPIFGWGPGTYTENYAPFQISYEKTLISTNAGDMGNAHSEYLGPLSESGVLGMLSFTLIVALALYYGLKRNKNLRDKKLKSLHLSIVLGFITYVIHGFLNNFLDTDKLSIPFWSFIAIIVVFELFNLEESGKKLES
jgi:O-antigen ligase